MVFSKDSTPVEIIKSKRKTISIEIKADKILVRAPRGMSSQAVNEVLQRKSSWIEKHYKMMREREQKLEKLPIFTEEELKRLTDEARRSIPQKVKYYAKLIGVTYGRITIRRQHTRWGSCSSKGNLNFNCLLMLFPDEVIDSIVVHELCHRKHMNHSVQFYAEIEKVFPEYKRCQKWLKENGVVYLKRLP